MVIELSDGTCRIETGFPTPLVLAEYAAAVVEQPEDARLHLHYGIALQGAGRLAEALVQLREAARLEPSSPFARSMLAGALQSAGRVKDAVSEYREALRLFHLRSDGSPDQQEAILRWGLAKALRLDDNAQEAIAELELAITIQRSAIAVNAGSPRLLRQLEALLAQWSGFNT
jgi:tetratricopeptide (TPR) repeat protein